MRGDGVAWRSMRYAPGIGQILPCLFSWKHAVFSADGAHGNTWGLNYESVAEEGKR